MNNKSKNSGASALMDYFSGGSILFALIVGFLIYFFWMGQPGNFENNDVIKGHPKNILGGALSKRKKTQKIFPGGPGPNPASHSEKKN